MNKKYDFYIIYALAIVLMLLASCKSKQTVQESAEATAIHNVSLEDSIRSDVSFSFDEMLLYIPLDTSITCNDSSAGKPLNVSKKLPLWGLGGLVRVVNGRFEKSGQEVKKKQVCDTLKISSEKHTSVISPPPRYHYYLALALIILLIILVLKTSGCKFK